METELKMFVATEQDTDWRSSASRQGPRGRGRRSGSWTTAQLLNIFTLNKHNTLTHNIWQSYLQIVSSQFCWLSSLFSDYNLEAIPVPVGGHVAARHVWALLGHGGWREDGQRPQQQVLTVLAYATFIITETGQHIEYLLSKNTHKNAKWIHTSTHLSIIIIVLYVYLLGVLVVELVGVREEVRPVLRLPAQRRVQLQLRHAVPAAVR